MSLNPSAPGLWPRSESQSDPGNVPRPDRLILTGLVEIRQDDILHLADNPLAERLFGGDRGTAFRRASELGAGQELVRLWVERLRESSRRCGPVEFICRDSRILVGMQFRVTVSPIGESRPSQRYCYLIRPLEETEAGNSDSAGIHLSARPELCAPTMVVAESGRVLEWSESLEQVSGVRKLDAVGSLIPEIGKGEFASLADLLKAEGRTRQCETKLRAPGGELRTLLWSVVAGGWPGDSREGFLLHGQDITTLVRTGEALKKAKTESDQANKAKSDFLAMMSHEVRTPMNGIIGMADLVLETPLTEEQEEFVSNIRLSARGLLTIINEILDFSKIEAGRLDLERTLFDLAEWLDISLKPHFIRAKQKGLQFRVVVAPDVPKRILGDPLRLQQVLTNLVSNAIKFTETGEVVVLVGMAEVPVPAHAQQSGAFRIHFVIKDTGIGVPVSKQESIFASFSQADSSTTRKFGGTGLGLAISLRLVELMRGSIWLHSEENKGSEFHFTALLEMPAQSNNPPESAEKSAPEKTSATFPVKAGILEAGSPLPAARSNAEEVAKQNSHWIQQPWVSVPEKEFNPNHLRILVVEDQPTNQKLALTLLKRMGHETRLANNGREALEILDQQGFDLILMDVQMPEMDGFETTKRIRLLESGGKVVSTNNWMKRIPIIALTANAIVGDREKCLQHGMDDYLSKPMQGYELARILNDWGAVISRALQDKPAEDPSSASAGESEENPLNWEGGMALLDGDEDLLFQLAEVFLEREGPLKAQLQKAVADGNAQLIKEAAHNLKGCVKVFGSEDVVGTVVEMERIGRENDLATAAGALRKTLVKLEVLRRALESRLAFKKVS